MGDVVHIDRVDPACATADPDLFFLVDGETYVERAYREQAAKAVCAACPVLTDCWTLHQNERYGIWGGETENERASRKRRQRRRKKAAA